MRPSTIAIIGSGAVGSTIAYHLILKNIAQRIMLIDADEKKCAGECLDLSDTLPFSYTSFLEHGSFEQARNADIIVIAAGKRQKPGEKREVLLQANAAIISSIAEQLHPIGDHTVVIMVTNPVDTLTWYAHKLLHTQPHRIFGTGTALDTQRLQVAIGRALNIAPASIHAYMMGEHGDNQYAAWSRALVGAQLIETSNILTAQQRDAIESEVRNKAYAIIEAKQATYFGIAACTAQLCTYIMCNTHAVLPVSYYHKEHDVCISAPIVLGRQGIISHLAYEHNEKEATQFAHGVASLISFNKRVTRDCQD